MFSIILLTHNSEKVIIETLNSIKFQTLQEFELVISDDCSTDNTNLIIKNFIASNSNLKIKYLNSEEKIGYPLNLRKAFSHTTYKYIFLSSHDDILSKDILKIYKDKFLINKNISAITRPYFWFSKKIDNIIRIKKPINLNQDMTVSIDEKNLYNLAVTISSFDQLSSLCIKREFVEKYGFSKDVFTAHARPFLKVLTEDRVLFINQFLVAVRFEASMSRSLKSIYSYSPLREWVKQINELKYIKIRKYLLNNYFFKNYVGLVQIKVFGSYYLFLREAMLMIKYRPLNIMNIGFWFFFLICLILPSTMVRKLSDFYKFKINSKIIREYHKYIDLKKFKYE